MDVRCTKCGIEYEFDDAKVTAAGVTVKCTSCGHVFKVKREEPATVPGSPSTSFGSSSGGGSSSLPGKGDNAEWMVKRVDGQVFRFKELTTLQKWIVERKVGRDDEISKTGKTWKKLGEIAELASFFQVVDAANAALHQASLPPSPPPAPPPLATVTTLPPAGPAPSMPPIPLTATTQPAGAGPSALGVVPAATSVPPAMTQPTPPPTNTDVAPMPVGPPTVPIKRAGRPTGDVDLGELDDDDPVLQMIKRRRRNAALFVMFILLVGAGGAGYFFWPQLGPLLGLAPPPAVAHPAVDDATKAIRADSLEGLQKAREALNAPKDSAELAAQVRVDVAIASHLRAQARALEALNDPNAKAKKDEAASALAKAYGTLTKVRAEAPQLVGTHLASAAYQLEKGALAEQRADLELARGVAHGPNAAASETTAVDAEIATLQALADAEAGLAGDAAAALAKLPATDDGRILAARAALSVAAIKTAIDVDVARSMVEGIPANDDRRTLWMKIVDAKATQLKVATPAADAGVVASADAGTVTVDGGAAAAATPSEEPVESLSYEQVMQKAERARVNERSKAAYDLFARAAKMKPGPRPWLGIGWAALDLGRNSESVRAFQKALSYDENLSDAQFGLAEALKISGRNAEAKTAYEEYLRMDPNGRDAGIAKRALESLQ